MAVKFLGREIEAITFDFWWTLFKDKDGLADSSVYDLRVDYLSRFCEQKGKKRSKAEISRSFEEARAFFERRHKSEIYTSAEDVVSFLLNELGVRANNHEVRFLANQLSYLGSLSQLVLLEGAEELLFYLKSRGVKIGLISDTVLTKGRHLVNHMRKAGVLKYFDALVFSDEVHRVKPDREMFKTAMKKLQAHPLNSAHIGDFPWSDIEGALRSEMIAIQYTGGNGPEKENIHPKANFVIKNFLDLIRLFENV